MKDLGLHNWTSFKRFWIFDIRQVRVDPSELLFEELKLN